MKAIWNYEPLFIVMILGGFVGCYLGVRWDNKWLYIVSFVSVLICILRTFIQMLANKSNFPQY